MIVFPETEQVKELMATESTVIETQVALELMVNVDGKVNVTVALVDT